MPNAHYSSSVQWNGGKVDAAVKAGGRAGVRKGGERLKSLSVEEAPVDSSALRGAATVKLVNAEPVAYVVYDTPYALKQHEDTSLNHTEGANGEAAGKAHYLSDPLTANAKEIQQIIGEEIRVRLAVR